MTPTKRNNEHTKTNIEKQYVGKLKHGVEYIVVAVQPLDSEKPKKHRRDLF